jgi:pescadillo protein
MREKKKGERGIAASYMTRNKAVRKLQLTLKDFRRLCILKGIFPRDPKKKKAGKDKTYYHVKDIKYLAHEPLLAKFRELKTFLKKRKAALVKKETGRMAQLEKTKPVFTYHHLVKERYPTFVDALRDMDDPLCMLALFAALPANLTKDHKPEMLVACTQLLAEFQSYVFRTKTLRKVFVSVKGIYYQALIQGQSITWLSPHKFNQIVPQDVDIRVMLTFFTFYLTMVKFTNFKLYHEQGLQYPPKVDELAVAKRAGLAIVKLESAGGGKLTDQGGKLSQQEEEQAKVDQQEEREAFPPLEPPSAEEKDSLACGRLFKGLIFLLGREVPVDSLEFVLLAGGAQVLREDQLTEEEIRSAKISHQVMDRPMLQHKVFSRRYIQPQWVYDSFNMRALLPLEPYAPARTPPPHLSPFVDDAALGYIPAQRKVLQEWSGTLPKPADHAEEEEEGGSEEEKEEQNEEAVYAEGLAKETAGTQFSDQPQQPKKETQKKKPAEKRKKGKEEEDLAKIMMPRKDARLFSKMQYGIKQKADQVAKLKTKRAKLEST